MTDTHTDNQYSRTRPLQMVLLIIIYLSVSVCVLTVMVSTVRVLELMVCEETTSPSAGGEGGGGEEVIWNITHTSYYRYIQYDESK